jgi:hypothetical protein
MIKRDIQTLAAAGLLALGSAAQAALGKKEGQTTFFC